MGTLNHFAKDLGIPLDVGEAVGVLCQGQTIRVDVGDASGTLFLNNATLGIYFQVVRLRERWRPRVGKWPALAAAVVAALARPHRPRLELEVDGRPVTRRLPVVWLGNNEYEHALPDVGTRHRLDGGSLTLVLMRDGTRLARLADVARVLTGREHLARGVDIATVKRVVVRSRDGGRLHVALDGELRELQQPLTVEIRPLALRVRAP